jgi:hypothetical protein
VATSSTGTELEVGDGAERVEVPAWPDAVRADRAARMLDRVLWQRLDVGDGTASAIVVGTRHRRPVNVRVDGSAALGLLEAGVPTLTRRLGTGS